MTTCFGPLWRWLLNDWPSERLAVAIDASTLGTLFTVLCLSVVYRGTAIPIAWKILPATTKGSWKEPWLDLLQQFAGIVPEGWTVVVLADRGLWAKWLFEGICKLGWHPMLRINQGGKFRPRGWVHLVPLTSLVPQVGSRWRGYGSAFATRGLQVECTLLAFWGEGHEEAWLILTDLAPSGSAATWYGLRSWIEQFFKDRQRGGWQWQHTRMKDPARAERLWLALAVAMLWLVRTGGADDEAETLSSPPEVRRWRDESAARPRARHGRLVSVWQRGGTRILVALVEHRRLPMGDWRPEPWPEVPELSEPLAVSVEPREAG